MDRVQQGTSVTISNTFYADGVPTDPSPATATVQILRADGTEVVPAGTAASRTATGVFTFGLTPTHTALLDTFTVKWTATFSGVPQTYTTTVEVAGGFLVSLADLRGLLPDTTVYPATRLAQIRTECEQRIEKALGYAVVPRYELRTLRSYGLIGYRLKPNIRSIRSFTAAGVAYTTDQIAAIALDPESGIIFTSGWWGGPSHWIDGEAVVPSSAQVTVGFEHGLDHPDADISRAAILAATELYSSGIDARIMSQTADNMSVTYRAVGTGDLFVNSELNAILANNRLPAIA